tara:strand:+ start:239 stop:1123 length:885 start_codon:yes stop_codon:yes gene_type:complete
MNIRRRPPNPSVKVANLEYAIPHSDGNPQNILEEILWEKNRELEIARQKVSLEKLKSQVCELPKTRSFLNALKKAEIHPAVIAEIKKASPSKGVIRKDFNPTQIAESYKQGGATCLSVLTEKNFFQGGFDVLVEVRKTVDLPIICKDFIFTPYQLYQARVAGADAVLFIASVLSDQDLLYLKKIADSLDLAVLVEVHDFSEIDRVLKIGRFELIGINNRDLKTFKTDISTTEKIAKTYAVKLNNQGIILVSESGLATRQDLNRVYSAGAKAVLVGESLMKEQDIKLGLNRLIKG